METTVDNATLLASRTSRINWGAIIGGTIIAMFSQLLLGLLGVAIGVTAIDLGTAVPVYGLSIGTGIWLVLITIISAFIGAFAAGRFAGVVSRYDGLLHGVATLALLTVISLFMISAGASNVISGAFSYGIQAAQVPQVQQVIKGQSTGAAAQVQMTPQQQATFQRQADRYVTGISWTAFITGLLSLIAAAVGGLLGMKSRLGRNNMNPATPA